MINEMQETVESGRLGQAGETDDDRTGRTGGRSTGESVVIRQGWIESLQVTTQELCLSRQRAYRAVGDVFEGYKKDIARGGKLSQADRREESTRQS